LSVARADAAPEGELGLFMQLFDDSYVRSFVTVLAHPNLESPSDNDINKSVILRLLVPASGLPQGGTALGAGRRAQAARS
jgi:hypothetical protein